MLATSQPVEPEQMFSSRPRADAVLRVVDPAQDLAQGQGWDAAVASIPGATFFHGKAWAAVLRESYGFNPCYLTLVQDGAAVALLPLLEAVSGFAGRRGLSLPFTDECGPIADSPGHSRALVDAAIAHGRAAGWRYVEFRGGGGALDGQLSSQAFLGHRLSLMAPTAKLFEQLEGSVRRAIKKGERSGVDVEVGASIQSVETFYQLHCRTRRRHGLPPQPFSFFRNIHRHILEPGLGFVSLAKHSGRPVAASVFFHFEKKAIYKFGASDERFQEFRGSNLVMWEAIRKLAQEGFEQLSFGRTSPGEDGLRRFKLSWGAEEYPIAYHRYGFQKEQYVPAQDRACGWHNHVFRRMPLPVLRLVGRLLYPHAT